ncbi:MAG: hypothetical protein GY697_07210, partial [Desulfobacterales bacterium]|nr:hypothetical protein [Desulfobacterales bacterium]
QKSLGDFQMNLQQYMDVIRVFGIDVQSCDQCAGAVRVIACIKDPRVIKKILDHLDKKTASDQRKRRPQSRAPPQGSLFN